MSGVYSLIGDSSMCEPWHDMEAIGLDRIVANSGHAIH
jgi:hypothetical protein